MKKVKSDWIKREKCRTNNIEKFIKLITKLAPKKKLNIIKLSSIKNYPLILLKPKKISKGPKILIAAGFHGEEQAGPWGIIEFLRTPSNKLMKKANVSFLPLINPTGFSKGRRENDWMEIPNTGYLHKKDFPGEKLSKEDKILMKNINLLVKIAKDGFVSLHEDSAMKKCYIYTFEKSEKPEKFSSILIKTNNKFFKICPNTIISEGGMKQKVTEGIIFNCHDGSFEDKLFHKGVPRTACTETPGLANINKRIQANAAIIKSFIKFSISNTK